MRNALKLAGVNAILLCFVLLLVEVSLRLFHARTLLQDPEIAFVRFGPFYRPKARLDIRMSTAEGVTSWKINSRGLGVAKPTIPSPKVRFASWTWATRSRSEIPSPT